jgi:hypothetical protein
MLMRAGSIGMKTFIGQIFTVVLFAGVIFAVFKLLLWMTH